MGAGKSGQTIGYMYYMSLHMGLARGPLNEIVDIWVGGLSAWKGLGNAPICIKESGQSIYIDAPDLFGGEKKEGGIQGPAYVYNGARDQVLQPGTNLPDLDGTHSALGALVSEVFGITRTLPGIAASLGGDVPNFRGVTTIWYNGEICAMNPYPKEWAFRIRRTTAGWFDDVTWYEAKATIVMEGTDGEKVFGMNPSHMLMEVNTNPEWGRGMPMDLIDENSFIYSANQLCDEGFGLCIPWFRRESIKEFIPIIINHVGGALYIDRETGKLTFRLIRNDYDPADLPTFGPDSGLLRVEDDDSSTEETAFNEISVTGFDPVRKEDMSMSVHNLASIQSVGEIISNSMEFKGIATRPLLARVATRELKAQSTSQRRFTLYLDRRGWRIKPAMPFKIHWPAKGIDSMIVRAGEITDDKGEIQIKVVEDIFGMPETTYLTPTDPVWAPPNTTPAPADEERLVEANYRDFYRAVDSTTRDNLAQGDSYIEVMASPPVGVSSYQYDLATRAGSEDFDARGTNGYTTKTTLADAITPLQTAITLDPDTLSAFLVEFVEGMVALVDNEQVAITSIDSSTGEAVVKRGVADTLPADHATDATLWLVDDDAATDGRVYVDGETVHAKVLPRTNTARLSIDDAADMSLVVDQRVFRPYPPGDVKIDGVSIYAGTFLSSEPVLTWAHRDRLLQGDQTVGHTEASIGPETGVQYRIRVYASDGTTLLNTYYVDDVTWTYTSALQTADAVTGGSFVLEMVSIRSDGGDITVGTTSYFKYTVRVFYDADLLEVDGDIVLIDGEGISYE